MIPLLKPSMPSADDLAPYLRRMDGAGWYSNFGPLVAEFEERLAEHFGLQSGAAITVSSGTAGLVLALRVATQGREGNYCLVPAWTFAATAQAVLAAGLKPLFCDVDEATGTLTPVLAEQYLTQSEQEIAAILPVAPFGAAVDALQWDALRECSGVPVVVDAAASFDQVKPGKAPVMVSLHATKLFGVGEGGVVVTEDESLARELRQGTVFGFAGGRKASAAGTNAKMSEYHAAVGLAQFERWAERREAVVALRREYERCLSDIEGGVPFPRSAGEVSATLNLRLSESGADAAAVVEKLRQQGIGAGIWWEDILHQNQVFGCEALGPLDVSEALYRTVLALPFHLSLSEGELDEIERALRGALA